MATTSPDKIRTPNPTDPYNLVSDLAIMANDTQAALVKRGNMYFGTAAQRNAFTNAPNGTHWQDTDGKQYEWVRKGGAWRGAKPLGGLVSVAGAANVTRDQVVTLPAGYFASEPSVVATIQSSSPQNGSIGIAVDSATKITIRLHYKTATTVPVHWIAFERSV